MKTELFDFIWDIISEENIKKLNMENITYTHSEKSNYVPKDGVCKDFFFLTKEEEAFFVTIILEKDDQVRQIELNAFISSADGTVPGKFLTLNYQKYKDALEIIRKFFIDAVRQVRQEICEQPKTRLFFPLGYALYIDNEVDETIEGMRC